MYKCFPYGLLGSNTYVVWDEASREGMIIDAGNPTDEIKRFCDKMVISVKYVILTHAHYDHAHYVGEYRDAFPEAKICAHREEVKVMVDPVANVSTYFGVYENYGYPDLELSAGDVISIGNTVYKVIHTPGHTPGSICLYDKEAKLMFTGDTLFMGGRGRCDFKYGSEEEIAKSLHKLLEMDGDIAFLSGHGGLSYIRDERGRVF